MLRLIVQLLQTVLFKTNVTWTYIGYFCCYWKGICFLLYNPPHWFKLDNLTFRSSKHALSHWKCPSSWHRACLCTSYLLLFIPFLADKKTRLSLNSDTVVWSYSAFLSTWLCLPRIPNNLIIVSLWKVCPWCWLSGCCQWQETLQVFSVRKHFLL